MRDHSIPIASMLAMAILVFAVADAQRVVTKSAEVNRTWNAIRARLAAEEAAFAVDAAGPNVRSVETSWGLVVRVERMREHGEHLRLAVSQPRGTLHFRCDWLRGSGPRCLARRLTLGSGFESIAPPWIEGSGPVSADSMPQLAPAPGATSSLPGLFLDSEVAFLHLAGGTDRSDFTLTNSDVPPDPDVQLVDVLGNLWLLPARDPLRIVLRAPLTLVVHGNIYLGRSIEVVGNAPLTLVAHRKSTTFRDLDGDGACSSGEPVLGGRGIPPLEGDGSIYLGLPRATTTPIAIASCLVAEGEIHLLTTTHLHGALVGAHGLTRVGDHARLAFTGGCMPDVGRTRIPGFATTGPPRPGHLRRVDPGVR